MSNNNSNQNSGGGRKKGNTNKYNPESRKMLLEILGEGYINKLDKLMGYVPFDKRLTVVKPFIKVLCTTDDELGNKTREKVFEGLKEQLLPNKLRTYFNQLPPEKKAIEIRQWIQMLSPEQIEKLFKGMK